MILVRYMKTTEQYETVGDRLTDPVERERAYRAAQNAIPTEDGADSYLSAWKRIQTKIISAIEAQG